MFGSKRKQLAHDIYEALFPNISIIQKYYGNPANFWDDPYVMGFLMGQIVAFKYLSGAKELPLADHIYINMTVLERLSHLNRGYLLDSLERAQTLMIGEFKTGKNNGELCTFGTFHRIQNLEDNPDYLAARDHLINTNQKTDHSDIMGEVYRRLWFEEIKRRLLV